MSTLLPFSEPEGMDLFTENGTALSRDQRLARAKRKGLCSRCGIKTHNIRLTRRVPISNDQVYQGHCIKCDPDMVPLAVCVKWEQRNPDEIALARRTHLHRDRGAHRQQQHCRESHIHLTENQGQHRHSSPSNDNVSAPPQMYPRTPPLPPRYHQQQQQQQRPPPVWIPTVSDDSISEIASIPHYETENGANSLRERRPHEQLSMPPDRQGGQECSLEAYDYNNEDQIPQQEQGDAPSGDNYEAANLASDALVPLHTSLSDSNLDEVETQQPPAPATTGAITAACAAMASAPELKVETEYDVDVAIATEVVLLAGSPDKESTRAPVVVDGPHPSADMSVPLPAIREIDRITANDANQSEWPLPWPLFNNSEEDSEDDTDSDENDVQQQTAENGKTGSVGNSKDDGSVQSEITEISSLRLSLAEESDSIKEQHEQLSNSFGAASLGKHSFSESSQQQHDSSMSLSNFEKSLSSTVEGSSSSKLNEPQQLNSSKTLSSSNSFMTEMLSAGDLASWLQDLAAEAHESDDFRAEVAEKGGIVAVISAMKLYKMDVNIQRFGCSSLRWLAKEHAVNIAHQGGVNALLSAIKHHGQRDCLLFEHATDALPRVVVSDTYTVLVAKKGGVASILAAMQKHLENVATQENACMALFKLSSHRDIIDAITHNKHRGIHIILESMTHHKKNLELQQCVCGILKNMVVLRSMVVQKESVYAHIVKEGGVSALVQAMNWHVNSLNLQRQALYVLCEIFTTQNLTNNDVIGATITAMGNHTRDGKIQQYGLGVLKHLSVTKKNIYSVVKLGGIPIILDAMQNYIDNAALQRFACSALKHLSLSATNEVSIATQGGISAVVGAMREHKHDGTVQREACGALRNLSLNDKNKALVEKHGGVASMLVAMKHNTHDADLQRKACFFLMNVSSNTQLRRAILSNGGDIAVIAIMKQHVSDAKVQQGGCGTLKNLSASSEIIKAIISHGGIDAILAGMKRHMGDPKVQSYACGALKSLAGTAENRQLIAKQKGVVAIIDAMKQNPSDTSVQEQACVALLNLSKGEQQIITSIAKLGGIGAIIKAMRQHSKNSSVQSGACAALWNLSTTDSNQAIIFKISGIPLIVASMKGHVAVPSVQQKACLALSNMAVTEKYRSSIADSGGIDAVIESMKYHPKDAQLQKYGCKLLMGMLKGGSSHKHLVTKAASTVREALQLHSDNDDLKRYSQKVLGALTFDIETESGKTARQPVITSIDV